MTRRHRPHRPTYQRSGHVAWLRFLPLALVTLLIAAGMAYVWFLAHDAGWGYWIVTPVVLALPVALAAFLAVAVGHGRNAWVAGVLGALATVVFHAGYFHADFVRRHGPDALLWLDLLPEFIGHRMATDGVLVGQQILPRSELYNWFYSVVELLVLNLIITGLAVYRSLFAYCEACGRWMRSIALQAEPGISYEIADALEDGNWADIPETMSTGVKFQQAGAWVEFEYCPGGREPGKACPAYLTLKENRGGTEPQDVLMYQGQITAGELDALASRVAALTWLRVSAPTADDLPPTRPLERYARSVTAVERLPADAGGQDLDRGGKIEMVLALVTLGTLLAGIGLVIWGAVRAPWADPAPTAWVGYVLLTVGSVMVLVGGVTTRGNVHYLGLRYAIGRLRARLAQRPDALIPADDPDAWFVEIVPRVQWHQLIPDKAADRGLLRLDRAGRRLLFEGLKERYVIPTDAVLACEVVPMMPHTGTWNLYAVVLTVRYPAAAPASVVGGRRGEEWEVPLLPRPTRFRRYGNAYRRDLAEDLRGEIEEMLDGTARGVSG